MLDKERGLYIAHSENGPIIFEKYLDITMFGIL